MIGRKDAIGVAFIENHAARMNQAATIARRGRRKDVVKPPISLQKA
jgi:hypothetical protein